MSRTNEPKITPGLYLKKGKSVLIGGKPVQTVQLERDIEFKHNKRPDYRIKNLKDDMDITTA